MENTVKKNLLVGLSGLFIIFHAVLNQFVFAVGPMGGLSGDNSLMDDQTVTAQQEQSAEREQQLKQRLVESVASNSGATSGSEDGASGADSTVSPDSTASSVASTSTGSSTSSEDGSSNDGEGNDGKEQGSDAVVEIACVVDGEVIDINDLPSASPFACNETIECGVWFKNMGQEATENFSGSVEVTGGTIDHSRTATTPGFSCEQTGPDSYACDNTGGEIDPGAFEDLILFIDLPDCDCEEENSFDILGTVQADNDTDTTNNATTHTVTYIGDQCPDQVACLETQLNPETVELDNGDFEVTCVGENVDKFVVTVEKDNQLLTQSPNLEDTDGDGIESWTYTPTEVGEYEFTCIAWGEHDDAICPVAVGDVIEQNQCEDDINLTVTSHTNGEVVDDETITLSGSFDDLTTVVRINGLEVEYSGTNDWTYDVTLTPGYNYFEIIGENSDPECTESILLEIYYDEQGTTLECTDTTVTPSVLELNSGSFEVTCQGVDVESFYVEVEENSQLIQTSPTLIDSDGNDQETWIWTPGSTGNYTFTCFAQDGSDLQVCPIDEGVVENTQSQCTDPIVDFDVDSHVDGQTVTSNQITLQGSIDPGYADVAVNGTPATVTSNSWFLPVTLQPGANTFTITANTPDPDCEETLTLTIIYDAPTGTLACLETAIQPDVIDLGDEFEVTCTGQNVDYFEVEVEQNGQMVAMSNQLFDTNNDDIEIWNWTPSAPGEYDFTCFAYNGNSSEVCPVETGTVYDQWITDVDSTVTCDGWELIFNHPIVTDITIEIYDETTGNLVGGGTYGPNNNPPVILADTRDVEPTAGGDVRFEISYHGGFKEIIETIPDNCGTTGGSLQCLATTVDPDVIVLGNGDFEVTCSGNNVDYFQVDVTENGQPVTTSPDLIDTNNDDIETWNWTPSATGEYEFTCTAFDQTSSAQCNADTGIVNDHSGSCSGTVNCDGWTLHLAHPLVTDLTVELYDVTTGELVGEGFAPANTNPMTMMSGDRIVQPTDGGEIRFDIYYSGGLKQLTETMPVDCGGTSGGICEETTVDPSLLELGNGDFAVTCTGQDVDFFNVRVEENGQLVTISPNLIDTNNDDTETWNWTPTYEGTFTFTCVADGYIASPSSAASQVCTPDVGVVETGGGGPVCTDPITAFSVDNYTSGDIVNTGNITLEGTIMPVGSEVYIDQTNGQTIQATVTGTSWEADVTLEEGNNSFEIYALSPDPLCDQEDFGFEIELDSNGGPDQPMCIDTSLSSSQVQLPNGTFQVTCEGNMIDEFVVKVERNGQGIGNSPVLIDTDNNDTETWQYTPQTTGNYTFTCVGTTQGDDYLCPSAEGVVTDGGGGPVCTDPITALSIDNYTDGAVLDTASITLTGTIEPVGSELSINQSSGQTIQATVTGTTWEADVTLEEGNNTFTLSATSPDPLCQEEVVSFDLVLDTNGGGPVCTDPIDLTITTPTNNQVFTGDSVAITGMVGDLDAELTVDNNTVAVSTGGVFMYDYAIDADGNYTATVRASNDDPFCDVQETVTFKKDTGGGGGGGGGGRTSSITCGNGRLDAGEQCDDGFANGLASSNCTSSCQLKDDGGSAVCGNGIIEIGEQCDDGNTTNGDGCSNSCQLEEDLVIDLMRRPEPLTFRPAPAILPETGKLSRLTPGRIVQ